MKRFGIFENALINFLFRNLRSASFNSIQISQQDATVLRVYYLTFMCGSTWFGRLTAHHQGHTTALGASDFTVGRKRLGRCCRPDHDQQRSSCFLPTVKPEAPSAVVCSWWWAGRRLKHEPHINVK